MSISNKNLDPNNEQVHRVLDRHMELYKAKRIAVVQAECGKVWSPTIPFEKPDPMRLCPVCFPGEHRKVFAR